DDYRRRPARETDQEDTIVPLKINVAESSDKTTLSCVDGFTFSPNNETTHILDYKVENTGEFVCKKDGEEDHKIYVKCRTCDKCIKLDTAAAVGMVVGVLVATVLI
uniref:CD3 gamma/delta subunit Ig-like domain-containing protein n=1 Tax=Hucho hucho TaxID=62062 RepID=A0A4W5Q8T6_9TELE